MLSSNALTIPKIELSKRLGQLAGQHIGIEQGFDCHEAKLFGFAKHFPVSVGGSCVTQIALRVNERKAGSSPVAALIEWHGERQKVVKPDLLEVCTNGDSAALN